MTKTMLRVLVVRSKPNDLPFCSYDCVLAALEGEPVAETHRIGAALARALVCYGCGFNIADANEPTAY